MPQGEGGHGLGANRGASATGFVALPLSKVSALLPN